MPKTIALIPARGGSKGLPGKNVRLLAGKPMIAHTIDAAKQCVGIDAVYVSTDDAAIREASEAAGATVIDRPAELANDTASTLAVVKHFLDEYKQTHGDWPETLVLLQPTSPLRTEKHLNDALAQYKTLKQPATIVSVVQAKPVTWQGRIEGKQLVFHQAPDMNSNRQGEDKNYILNGAIYISSPERFYNDALTKPALYPYVMPQAASVDIDTLADFQQAEAILKSGTASDRKAVIVGSGGHAQVLYEALQANGVQITGWLETDDYNGPQKLFDLPVYRQNDTGLKALKDQHCNAFYFGVGMVKAAPWRQDVFNTLVSAGFAPLSVIHPTAVVSSSASIAPGCFVGAGVIVQPHAQIGSGCILNTGSVVEHHAQLQNNIHVGPRAVLCGNVSVGAHTMIGAGSVVIQQLAVGENACVAAGSVVVNDVPDNATVMGTPAKIIQAAGV